jgi:hypothetical protein
MSAAATASALAPSRIPPKPTTTPAAATERAFEKLLRINYDAQHPAPEYRPTDHSWGETWPGKQRPSTQLTLFSVGVKRDA